MKLIAIYNSFGDSIELLPYSLNCLIGHVDEILIIYQNTSNWGEHLEYEKLSDKLSKELNITYLEYIPMGVSPLTSFNGIPNETKKRNIGIQYAIEHSYTHFLCLDNDELYEDFGKAKHQYINSGAKGSVCQMWTYFKEPTLRFKNPEGYYVPFIHELRKDTVLGNHKYPFYCDPTRKPNEKNVTLIGEKMHHMSYVRKNIELKIRNSSAKHTIERGTVLEDYYKDLSHGSYIQDFHQTLIRIPNIFNIVL